MSKHTPGPWMVEGGTVYFLEHEGYSRGKEVFRNRWSAHVQGYNGTPEAELVANACLIAAAPELLEALKNFVDGCSVSVDAFAVARAAIAKATGEAK